MIPAPIPTVAALLNFRTGPVRPIVNSSGAGCSSLGSSPVHRKSPDTFSVISSYSCFARMHGGSLSSSLMGSLLATIVASSLACPSALRASGAMLASFPCSLQLSYESECHETVMWRKE